MSNITVRFYKKIFLIVPFWGGGTIFPRSLKTTGNKNGFQLSPKNFFSTYMTPLYLLKIVFPKFDPLTASGMAFSVNLGPKCQNLFPLV
jgi:hypothetical protein